MISKTRELNNALDRMWPTLTPEALLRHLYSTQTRLVEATEGVLTADERAALYRPVATSMADEPWTSADLFCLDELAALIEGAPAAYGHIVVDEAQDLSPLQARAIARRCPSSSVTLLGDLAQAAGPWIRDSWDELAAHLNATSLDVRELSVSYRVPRPALELAARQLPLISPGLSAPRSVRPGGGEVEWIAPGADELVYTAVDIADSLTSSVDEDQARRTVGLIVPASLADDVLGRARQEGFDVGDGRVGELNRPVTVLPAAQCRGVEFDHVVVLDPAGIVEASPFGRRDLYVAMTRCTQQLHLVHAGLPSGLSDPTSEAEMPGLLDPVKDPAWYQLLKDLPEQDQALVEALVRRLSHPVTAAG